MELIHKTIGDCLSHRARQSPDKTAMEYWNKSSSSTLGQGPHGGSARPCEGDNPDYDGAHAMDSHTTTYTWSDLDRLSDYMAVRMNALGIEKRTHAAIWSVNTPNWLITFLALQKLGAVAVLINTCYREQELKRVLAYGDVRYVYYGDGYKTLAYDPMVETLKGDHTCQVRQWIPMGRDENGNWMREDSFSDYERSQEARESLACLRTLVQPQDTAAILFTSGTTSFSKGVMLSHYNLVNSALGTLSFTRWNENDRLLLTVPLFHCFGITSGLLTCIHTGAAIVLMKYFKTVKVFEHVDRYRCTVLNGVPSMFLAMIHNQDFHKYSLKSLRSGIIAGSPISEKEYLAVHEKLPHMALLPSFGQTETSPCVTLMLEEDPFEKRVTTAGRLISHVELRICHAGTDRTLPEGKVGEIQVRGYNIMKGYYGMPEETKAVLSEDGWLKTGDLGFLDPEGYLHLAGRCKEMILRCGENIAPKEIEDCIRELPFVDVVKVIGIPAPVVQEMVVACIVPVPGMRADPDKVIEFLRPRLAHYKLPSYVLILKELPMNASGKILLQELKNQAIERIQGQEIKAKGGPKANHN